MISLPILDPHEPSLRVESLHALLYCPRLFYFQEVERVEVPHAAVFAGRELHESIDAELGDMVDSVEVESPKLGLHGKIDVLKRRDGTWIPYDHKRGRCMGGTGSNRSKSTEKDDAPQAWPSDRVQIVAYAVMLEEAFGQTILEARVRYHADNLTVRIPIDDAARQELDRPSPKTKSSAPAVPSHPSASPKKPGMNKIPRMSPSASSPKPKRAPRFTSLAMVPRSADPPSHSSSLLARAIPSNTPHIRSAACSSMASPKSPPRRSASVRTAISPSTGLPQAAM